MPAAVARGDGAVVAALSMSSPSSICWAIEMFGYGFLGLASLCVVPALPDRGVDRIGRVLLAANAVLSVTGAVLTARDARWVLTRAGLAAFAAWNVVILGMALSLALALRPGRDHAQG